MQKGGLTINYPTYIQHFINQATRKHSSKVITAHPAILTNELVELE